MLHPSPLPKFRGGSPIQNQIINGKSDSAVSIFKISEKLDEGDIIYQKYLSLEGELSKIFSEITKIGTKLSIKMINNFKNLKLKKQDNSVATYYSRRKPSQSEITINEIKNLTANDLYNKIRSLQDPYPNAFIKDKNGNKLFIVSAYTDKKK